MTRLGGPTCRTGDPEAGRTVWSGTPPQPRDGPETAGWRTSLAPASLQLGMVRPRVPGDGTGHVSELAPWPLVRWCFPAQLTSEAQAGLKLRVQTDYTPGGGSRP